MQRKTTLLAGGLLAVSGTLSAAQESSETYLDRATSTAELLIDQFYSEDNGQFDDLWWNSAITFTSLGDLSAILGNDGMIGDYNLYDMYENLYSKHTGEDSIDNDEFQNQYFDDEGWWALQWINAYDLTGEQKYLDIAESLVHDMWETGQACGGGIWWSSNEDTLTTIENVCLLGAAAYLTTRVDDAQFYQDVAASAWEFLQSTGTWDPEGYTAGGNVDNSTCQLDGSSDPSAYSQGVMIGAFLELAKSNDDDSYIELAQNIAKATMEWPDFLTDDGIFQNPIGSFSNDIAQFKGVFFRYLMILQRDYPDDSYVNFTTLQADSIWNNARNDDGTIIVRWEGNPDDADLGDYSLEVSTSSANQAILAAADMLS